MNHENKKIESAEELTLQSLGMILYTWVSPTHRAG